MDIRLLQRDHLDPRVADLGLTHRDPYFQACWGPLAGPWTTHLVSRVSELTRDSDVVLSVDDLSRHLSHEPAPLKRRVEVITQAMTNAERAGLGFRYPAGRDRQWFGVYRNVPLLDEPALRQLTDPELFAHAGAVTDVNRRLAAAGLSPVTLPDWVSARLGRGDPSVARATVDPAAAARARLDSARRPPTPTPPGLSL